MRRDAHNSQKYGQEFGVLPSPCEVATTLTLRPATTMERFTFVEAMLVSSE